MTTVQGHESGHEILFPALPYDMKPRAVRAAGDVRLQQFVGSATRSKDSGRRSTCRETFGERYDELRKRAGAIKQETLDHLDVYLERYIENAERHGVRVHYARDGAQANEICLAIGRSRGCRVCVKAKSMVTEETGLVPALQAAGIETVETDLGEFILQLDGDAPSHIVTPMIHKDRTAVGRAFTRELGTAYSEDPGELTRIAREHMRELFRKADLGISGANFLIAGDGSLVLCTNEGNADMSVGLPRVHIALVGIEKLIPALADLPIFIKLLARSATAQPITVYTTIVRGPRRAGECGGPGEVHVVLLDNGRTGLLASDARELLRCIRCGACLNACPVYRKVGGGHAYGAVYSGPIGAVLTPALLGLANYADLPRASSLCGACREACPVDIDIPGQLIRLRAMLVERRVMPWAERALMRAWTWTLRTAGRYRLASGVMRWAASRMAESVDGRGRGWLKRASGPAGGWTVGRDLPAPSPESFREWWVRERGGGGA